MLAACTILGGGAVSSHPFGLARVPKRGRSFTGNLAEHTVEMCQRLKTNLIRYFTDPRVRIKQQGFGLLDPHTTEIFCKMSGRSPS